MKYRNLKSINDYNNYLTKIRKTKSLIATGSVVEVSIGDEVSVQIIRTKDLIMKALDVEENYIKDQMRKCGIEFEDDSPTNSVEDTLYGSTQS